MLADRLRVAYAILERMVDGARAEKLVEVRGAAGTGTAGYRYALTDLGRDRARQFPDVNQYVGPARPAQAKRSFMTALESCAQCRKTYV